MRLTRPLLQGARIEHLILGGGTTGLAVAAALPNAFAFNRPGTGRAVIQSGMYVFRCLMTGI